MGTQGINGNNNDPMWKEALAEAKRLDAEDVTNNWIGKTVWDKCYKEYNDKQRPKGISVSQATLLIYKQKVLKSLKFDFSQPNNETFEIRSPIEEVAAEELKPNEVVDEAPVQKQDTSEKHHIGVLFHKILGREIFEKDQSGQLKMSYDKIKEKVNNADLSTLKELAANLGVNIRDNNTASNYSIDKIKQYINKTIDILKEADKNEDLSVSDNELSDFNKRNSNSYSNFNEAGKTISKKARLYEILGMVDGKYNNEQGGIGDCWLLGVGQSLSDNPEVYNKIFKKDAQGVTIMFYGIQGKNNKPYSVRITNKQIQEQHRLNMLGKNSGGKDYGSNDPDAIALELAMPKAINRWNKTMEPFEKYIANSTRDDYQKPDVSKLTKTMSEKEFSEVTYYLAVANDFNTLVNNGIKDIYKDIFDKGEVKNGSVTLTDEDFERVKTYIENQPEINPLIMIGFEQKMVYNSKTNQYKKNSIDRTKIRSYLINSHPKSSDIVKPEIPSGFIGKLMDDLNGGRPEIALQFLTGATSSNMNFVSKDKPSKLLTQEEFNKYKGKQRISVNFFEDHPERGIYGQHEYYIKSIDGNKVTLADSHDSNYTRAISVKEIEKWGAGLTPTDLTEVTM